jgi:hypothetical protein
MQLRTVFLGLALITASGCGLGRDFSAPRNLDDACALSFERPSYIRAMIRAERNWGVPVHVQMAMLYQESRFVGDARPPFRYTLGVIPMGRQSSALGYSQALDATWDEYRDDTNNRRARRTNINDATDFVGWYANQTLERNNVPLDDTRNQYLAYHEGQTGFRRGSYRQKPWLVRIAGELDARADMYQEQLEQCG